MRPNALVTFNTHDLSTYAGWRSFSDLKLKRSLGIDPGESDDARWHALAMLTTCCAITPSTVTISMRWRVSWREPDPACWRSRWRICLGVIDQPNIPGTVDEHPNWRRRLPLSIEHIAAAIDVAALKGATRERSLRRI